jgi:methionyl-tRNA synthetase
VRLVTEIDVFIQATEPFKLAKDASRTAELGAILYQCLEALRIAGVLLAPVMPVKMAELDAALAGGAPAAGGTPAAPAAPTAERVRWGGLRPGTQVAKLALFPRVESPDAPPAAAAAAPPAAKKPKTEKKAKPAAEASS